MHVFLIARIATYIADQIRDDLKEKVRNARVISICYDGATDCSVTEVEMVYVRLLDNGMPRSFYLKIVDVEHAHADGVYTAVNSAFEDLGMPDWKEKTVAAGSDGASVNIGVNNSVATRILADGHEYIIIIHCVAHRLELAVLQSLRNYQPLKDVQDILLKIHKHYHYSPKALRQLRSIAEAMEQKIIKPTRLQGTRWMPHMSKALATLLDSYPVLVAHFEHIGEERVATAEVQGRAVYLYRQLKNFRKLRFMFFMKDLLHVISLLSLTFQRDDITAVGMLDALETANLELVNLQQQPGENLRGFLDSVHNHTYRGIVLDNVPEEEEDHQETFHHVIETVREHINTKLEGERDRNLHLIRACQIFDLKDWPRDRETLAAYGNEQIQLLQGHYRDVLNRNGINFDAIRNEWTQMKAHLGYQLINNQAVPRIQDLFRDPQQEEWFHNVLMLAEITLVLPMCTANCERGFSAVKRIKTDWRATLSTSMLDLLLLVSLEGPNLDDYNALRALNRWWHGGRRARRPEFNQDQDGDGHGEDDLLNFMQQMQ